MTTWLNTTGVIAAMQTYALLWFFSRRHESRIRLPLKWLTFLVLDAAACLVINLLCLFISDAYMFYSFIYTVVVQFFLCTLLFKGDLFFQLFYILFANVYFTCVLKMSIFAEIVLLPRGALATPRLYGLFVNILPQAAAIAALIPLQRYTFKKEFYLSPPRFYWIFIYCVYLALYFGITYITDFLITRRFATVPAILLQFVMLLVTVSVYILYLSLCESYHEKLQRTLIEKQYSLQKAHFAEIQASNQALRELRHELKNYIFYMNYLIDQGDFEKLKAFFNEFYQKEHHQLYEVSAFGSFLDAVLQQKVISANADGITVEQQILLPEDDALNNLDLCIVLSNLIDNAMEACRNLPDPRISIRLKRVKDYLSIVVENTAADDVLKRNPQLRTRKDNSDLHGIGLRIIRQIIERYDGSIQFESDSTDFKVMAMMKIPANGESEASL